MGGPNFDTGRSWKLQRIDQNAKYKSCRYYIRLHFDTNPESLRPFVPWDMANNVFNLSATYDLDLWPKILKIFVSHGVPIRNMYAKFHNDRLRNGWDITLWNFAKTRTNKHTDRQTWALQYLALPLWGRGNYIIETVMNDLDHWILIWRLHVCVNDWH